MTCLNGKRSNEISTMAIKSEIKNCELKLCGWKSWNDCRKLENFGFGYIDQIAPEFKHEYQKTKRQWYQSYYEYIVQK